MLDSGLGEKNSYSYKNFRNYCTSHLHLLNNHEGEGSCDGADRSKNFASIPYLDIKWIGWLSSLTLEKRKTWLVIEWKTTLQANREIKEGLAIGIELH